MPNLVSVECIVSPIDVEAPDETPHIAFSLAGLLRPLHSVTEVTLQYGRDEHQSAAGQQQTIVAETNALLSTRPAT